MCFISEAPGMPGHSQTNHLGSPQQGFTAKAQDLLLPGIYGTTTSTQTSVMKLPALLREADRQNSAMRRNASAEQA